jgi:uncharacterized RDD family membrane protein YckC
MDMSDLDALHETGNDGPRQVVHSPEQVALHFPLAGPTSRILAYAIDLLVIYLIEASLLIAILLSTPLAGWAAQRLREAFPGNVAEPAAEAEALLTLFAFFVLVQLGLEIGYFVLLEAVTGGRSLGKRVLGLRVVRDGGVPLGLRESLIRNLLRTADALPANYLVGLVAMVLSPEGKRLGDVAAGTVVIRLDRPAPARPLPVAAPGAAAAFRFDRGQIAALGAEGRALVRQTLRRLDELSPETAEAALQRAVEALRGRLAYGAVAPEERRAFLEALLEASRRR